jgi:translocator protein
MIPTSPFYQALVGGVLFCTMLAALGGWFTILSPWYYALRQPRWKPRDWAFGPVWTGIFICLSLAIAYAWDASNPAHRFSIMFAVGMNGALNMLWSLIFFAWRQPLLALVEVVFFWISIVALIYVLGSASKSATLLLMPYIIWVSIAAVLNYEIVRLNQARVA